MKYLLTITVLFVFLFAKSQEVTNVSFLKINATDQVVINYNLIAGDNINSYSVELWVSPNCDNNFTQITTGLSGHFGVVQAGQKQIIWTPTQTINYPNCCFKVKAVCTKPTGFQNLRDFVLVQGGTFQMGSNDGYSDEKPIHSVTVSSFYISKYEVTNEEFCEFLNDYGSDKVKSGTYAGQTMIFDAKTKYSGSYPWGVYKSGSTWYPISGYAKYPVIYVTWYGANEYCKWAGGRLPTEAEWEYAAGGGDPSQGSGRQSYAGTSSVSSLGLYAWFSENSYDLGSSHSDYGTHPVGTKLPNSLGIYDMSGNVFEWCYDLYHSYPSSSQTNPTGPSSGSNRVVRGGSWSGGATLCRVADRYYLSPAYSNLYIGFRVARND